jgi:hypothetical protein
MPFGAIVVSPLRSVAITAQTVCSRSLWPAYAQRRTGMHDLNMFVSYSVLSHSKIQDVRVIVFYVPFAGILCLSSLLIHQTQVMGVCPLFRSVLSVNPHSSFTAIIVDGIPPKSVLLLRNQRVLLVSHLLKAKIVSFNHAKSSASKVRRLRPRITRI